MKSITDRFLQYVAMDTQSDEQSNSQPSTIGQLDLQLVLLQELSAMDVIVNLDPNGYLTAYIPANIEGDIPAIGFIAHVDTSPDCPGNNINPQIVENYNGDDIVLNKERGIVLSPQAFPELKNYIGQTLITTDGTTLLGADDKAGVAAIMQAIKYIVEHPDMPHGNIYFAFTPDEEVGRGTKHFDTQRFAAQYAYTIDGGEVGEIEFENFNAATATLVIHGTNIHPGYAKGKMISAINLAMEIDGMLPKSERPETTEGYEGFYHLTNLVGSVEKATMQYIIRDHDKTKFQQRKDTLTDIAQTINDKYGNNTVEISITDTYYNMKEVVQQHYHIVEKAMQAMEYCGITPKVRAIRGGTDGATLSFKGIPCPNIFAGGHNFHGRYEYLPVQSMAKATEVILQIITLFANDKNK
jgi:tripeptide aminopeptidase